jgi:predicted dehydrogenase
MAPTSRIAIVGCGAIVEQRYVSALQRMRWIPTALVDISAERRRSVAARLGACQIEAERADVCLDAFDAAVVSAPNAFHEPICVGLLRAGKHVLVEKPMALTAAACAAMNRAAFEGRARLAVSLPRRQDLAGRWLTETIKTNAFGQLRRFSIREGFEFSWPLTTDSLWRKDQAGGGVLIDTGSHTIDQVLWWFDNPSWVEYFDDADGGPRLIV